MTVMDERLKKKQWLEVARMSFIDGKKNNEIARILRPDKPIGKKTNLTWVQNLINEAGNWLIQEQICLEGMRKRDVEATGPASQLKERYKKLRHVSVVPGGEIRSAIEYSSMLKLYAEAAAAYFDEAYDNAEQDGKDLHISVSGGQAIFDMVSAFAPRSRPRAHFYAAALLGRGKETDAPHIGSETNATVAWSRCGRLDKHLHYATVAPYFTPKDRTTQQQNQTEEKRRTLDKQRHTRACENVRKQRSALLQNEEVKSALDHLNDKINMCFAGLGLPIASPLDASYGAGHMERLTMTGLLEPYGIEPRFLAEEGAKGDFAYCLFDGAGVQKDIWKFFVTAGDNSRNPGIDFYKRRMVKGADVIVIAGARKEVPLRIALEKEMLNVLITDEHTVDVLLNK